MAFSFLLAKGSTLIWSRLQLILDDFLVNAFESRLYSPSLTWNLKMMVSKKESPWNLLFQGAIFRFHMKLLEGICGNCTQPYPTKRRWVWFSFHRAIPSKKAPRLPRNPPGNNPILTTNLLRTGRVTSLWFEQLTSKTLVIYRQLYP